MTTFTVSGMSCAACSARVERAVLKVRGVETCSVNLLTGTMLVEGDFSAEQVINAVTDAGYGIAVIKSETAKTQTAHTDKAQCTDTAAPFDASKVASIVDAPDSGNAPDVALIADASAETTLLLKRFLTSLIFLIPLMYVSMGVTMWHFPFPRLFDSDYCVPSILQMLFSSIILFINRRFFINGAKALRHASATMDTLVSLGSGISYCYSVCILVMLASATLNKDAQRAALLFHNLYFESAAMILVLITLGKFLESVSKGKTTSALKSLLLLSPKTATLVTDGTEKPVPIEAVQVGDIFIVKAGDTVPVDGIVKEGHSSIDESSLTGESVYADKSPNSTVSAGTINVNGCITCRATRVGKDTTFAQIIKTVHDSTATKAPAQKVADKVAGVFVPVVMAIAVITFAVWLMLGAELSFALTKAVCVLVVSCPCALGLATPVAIMVANGVGAKNGILFKTSADLENLGKTRIVALDKTGTITKGSPCVDAVIPFAAVTKEELLKYAYLIEEKSNHPLAKAITRFCKETAAQSANAVKTECFDFTEIGGKGLKGSIKEDVFFNTDTASNTGAVTNKSDAANKDAVAKESAVTETGTANVEDAPHRTCTIYGGNLDFIKESCPLLFAAPKGTALTKDALPQKIMQTVKDVSSKGQTPVLFAASFTDEPFSIDSVYSDSAPTCSQSSYKAPSCLEPSCIKPLYIEENCTEEPAAAQTFLGIIGVSDAIKEESAGAVYALKKMGLKVLMLTGDNELTAKHIASRCGIDEENVIAGVLPLQKQAAILREKAHGTTCMVGDGINDAPSLVSADIGIAIGAGSDVALDAANIVLVKSRLDDVVTAIRLSKQTLKTIRQNLFWAFFYNATLIPLAAGVYNGMGLSMNPMFGALAMSLSSFCVVSNALRLNLFKKKMIIEKTEHTMTTTINVKGMMCAHCEAHVKEAVEKISGVTNVVARHETGEVIIESVTELNRALAEEAIIGAGYEVV